MPALEKCKHTFACNLSDQAIKHIIMLAQLCNSFIVFFNPNHPVVKQPHLCESFSIKICKNLSFYDNFGLNLLIQMPQLTKVILGQNSGPLVLHMQSDFIMEIKLLRDQVCWEANKNHGHTCRTSLDH